MNPLESAHFAVAQAEEGYTANVPISFLRDPLSLLATHADGEPLTPEHGGPLRLVVPREVLLEEREVAPWDRAHREQRPGFWERYGYHNDADPVQRGAVRVLTDRRSLRRGTR